MNKTPEETKELINNIKSGLNNIKCKIVLCVPFIDINEAVIASHNTPISIGAQNCHFKEFGAYTGEISPEMLKAAGVSCVILGHSERRKYFKESDEDINKKIKAAIKAGLKVILCVGESIEDKDYDLTKEVVSIQLKKAVYGLTNCELENIMIAYEPVWAIGTGKTATPEIADCVCGGIRKLIEDLYDTSVAEKVTILYGGSMNSKNAKVLLDMPNVDGGLIGGASLNAEDFLAIIEAAE